LAARILRVADAYAALTDARPYRAALTEAEARAQMIERAAIEFDPAIVSVLLAMPDIEELRSFAKTDEEVAAVPAPSDHGASLFSSFMR
jgi:HD-GYP domain-containing protein (c-di-GMP phosphodiesterase class II)